MLLGIVLPGYVETREGALTARTSLAHKQFSPLHRLLGTQENACK